MFNSNYYVSKVSYHNSLSITRFFEIMNYTPGKPIKLNDFHLLPVNGIDSAFIFIEDSWHLESE